MLKEILESIDKDSTYFADLDIFNSEVLYKEAMRAKNPADLKKRMIAMKNYFSDAEKIDFKKVDWEEIYSDVEGL